MVSCVDLTKEYYQIKLNKLSRKMNAFLVNGKQFQYKRLSFLLKSSGQLCIKVMERTLASKPDFLTINICIHIWMTSSSSVIQEHLHNLEMFIKLFIHHGLTINEKKSRLIRHNITFLGYIVSRDDIKPCSDQLEKIRGIREPKNIKEVQRRTGLQNFYQCIISNFSQNMFAEKACQV